MNEVLHNNSCIIKIWRLSITNYFFKICYFISLLFLLNSYNIYPQETLETDETIENNELPDFQKIDEEASESIFDFKIGDAQVDFFITGSWEANFVFASGFLIRPDFGTSLLDAFPGAETGFLFEQIPDLTLSIWLMNRFFVEFSVLGSFEQNSFLMGYQGEEDEFLHHIYLGNRDINIDPYPFISIPDQGDSSLGIEAELLSGDSIHQLLLRFDNNDEGKVTFIGKNEVTEERIPLNDFIKGRFFKLPDEDVQNLVVYIEDPDGIYTDLDDSSDRNDGFRYRKAGLEDATLDSERGLVLLKDEPAGKVFVYYTKSGLPVGDNTGILGVLALPTINANGFLDPDTIVNFDWDTTLDYLNPPNTMGDRRRAEISSNECLLLWEPASFSPFEIQAYYSLPANSPDDIWRILVSLVNKGDTDGIDTLPDIRFLINTDDDYFSAYKTLNLRDDLNNLYPFFNIDGNTNDWIYGPYSETIEGRYDKELLVSILSPVSGYYLDSNVLPGSVQVFRNGAEETRFTVDYNTGEVIFQTEIHPNDRIEIYYKKFGSLLNNGDLLFTWGNKVPLNDNLNLQIAAGFRWNFLPGAYSETAYSRTGALISSINLQGEYEHFKFNIETAISYTNPDTTGILRLSGMEKEGLDVFLSENTAYPASPPEEDIDTITMTAYSRGILYYKDYREYDFFGSYTLNGPNWNLPSGQDYPYVNGSKIGPYNVKEGSEEENNTSLVIDFELTGSNNWVGIQIPVYPGENVLDLSALKGLLLSYKAIDVTGPGDFDVHIQIGEIGEDLDEDFNLDKETSESSTGFVFNDSSNSVYLYVGDGPRQEGNGQLDTEDIDGNGFLDSEFPENILTLENFLANISSDTGWLSKSVIFTSNDREELTRSRTIRIIISKPAAAPDCSGRLLIDKLFLSGTTFAVTENTSSGGTVFVQEIREVSAQNPISKGDELINQHSIVSDTFHSAGEIQKVLEIDWNDFDVSESWTVRGYTETGTEGAVYRELNMFMRFPELTPASDCTFNFSLLDSEGDGITWRFTHEPFNDWRKLKLELDTRRLYIGGGRIDNADISISSSYGSLNQLQITITSTVNNTEGLLYIDELYFTEPEGAIGGAFSLETEINFPGTILSINDIPVLSDIIFREKFYAVSPGFSPLYGRPAQAWDTSSLSELSFGLFFIHFDLYFQAEGTDNEFNFAGGHEIQLPRFEFPVIFTDSFDFGTYSFGREFNRKNTLNFNLNKFIIGGSTGTLSRESVLSQNWNTNFSVKNSTQTVLDYTFGFTQSSSGYSHNEDNYFKSWIYAYEFFIPWKDGEPIERTGNMNISIPRFTEPFGVEVNLSVLYKSTEIFSNTRMQYNHISYDISFPITLNKNTYFTITPGYIREGSNTNEQNSEGDLFHDFGIMWYSFYLQTYVFNQPPVYEIWSSKTKTEFIERSGNIEEAFYYPEVYFEIKRRISSHISSLFLPTKMRFSTGRTFEKDHDLYLFLNAYSFLYQTNSINLFGKYGAYPVFNFYFVDEFINSFNMTLSFFENGELNRCEYNIENILSFEGRNQNIFTIENYLNITYDEVRKLTDKFSVGFKWFVYPEDGIRLPLLKERIVQTGYLINDETVSIEFNNKQDDMSTHPLNLFFTHSTTIRYPEHGYFKAFGSLGFDFESLPEDEENLYRILFQIGVEIKVEF